MRWRRRPDRPLSEVERKIEQIRRAKTLPVRKRLQARRQRIWRRLTTPYRRLRAWSLAKTLTSVSAFMAIASPLWAIATILTAHIALWLRACCFMILSIILAYLCYEAAIRVALMTARRIVPDRDDE